LPLDKLLVTVFNGSSILAGSSIEVSIGVGEEFTSATTLRASSKAEVVVPKETGE
jgi:hypothetical protein